MAVCSLFGKTGVINRLHFWEKAGYRAYAHRGAPCFLFPLLLLCGLPVLFFFSAAMDRARRRVTPHGLPVSVVIPCYNDAGTISQAVESVYASWPADLLDVQVIHDGGSDGSGERIAELARRFPIRVTDDGQNHGKAARLNTAALHARHETLLFLDADTEVNAQALAEMLARLTDTPDMGAVSSPCTPLNRGFLPSMQAIEYNMHRLTMGACNLTSVQSLWGGCLLTRRSVFLSLGGFDASAITEDSDYAFRINRAGYRVEQGFTHVRTEVPIRLRDWLRQKIRWTAGLTQCAFRHSGVWLRNPVVLYAIVANAVLILHGASAFFDGVSGWELFRSLRTLHHVGIAMPDLLRILPYLDGGVRVIADLLTGLVLTLVTLLHIFPLVNRVRDALKFILVIPFTLGYLPAFALASFLGFLFWARALRKVPANQRAW